MANTSTLKSNLLPLTPRVKVKPNIHNYVKLCCAKFPAAAKLKASINFTSNSNSKYSYIKIRHDPSPSGLKVPSLVRVQSLLLIIMIMIMMMCGCDSALAHSLGDIGGRSFSWMNAVYSTESWFHYNIDFITTTIIKLQIGLFVDAGSLRKELERIAEEIYYSTPNGWSSLLEDTTDCLLDHSSYVISGHLSEKVEDTLKDAEKYFAKLLTKERMKFKEKYKTSDKLMKISENENTSVDQVNQSENRKISENGDTSIYQVNQTENMHTHMVVTILVAINGVFASFLMPNVRNHGDVKKALKRLKFLSSLGGIQGINVLWTPQQENEILSLEEIQKEYPRLKN